MSGTEGILSYIPLILMVAIFWFMVIRPQQKRAKELQKMLTELKKGDEVLLSSGLLARVIKTEGEFFVLEVAPEVEVVVQRSVITAKMEDGTIKQARK